MILKKILQRLSLTSDYTSKFENIQLALGRIEKRQIESAGDRDPAQWEFKVTSQWGEDGIIQFLTSRVRIPRKIFVEFGVEDYSEANTRFLLQNNYWSGLVIDGSADNIQKIKSGDIYWKYNLKAHHGFITKDNIDSIITSNGIRGEIGLLSVDIDGNDYWVWEAIQSIQPIIVVCEYNSLFGPSAKVSVPYDPAFVRNSTGRPNTYYGASIAALTFLAQNKGYELVAGNHAGNNIFFVKSEFVNDLKILTPHDAFARASFRESRNADGSLSFKNFDEARQELSHLPLIDVEKNTRILVKEII